MISAGSDYQYDNGVRLLPGQQALMVSHGLALTGGALCDKQKACRISRILAADLLDLLPAPCSLLTVLVWHVDRHPVPGDDRLPEDLTRLLEQDITGYRKPGAQMGKRQTPHPRRQRHLSCFARR